MTLENILIRPAEARDAESIAKIKVEGWQTAYRGIVDDAYLRAMSIPEQSELFKNVYSPNTVFIAEADNEILGFCRFRICEDEKTDCEIRELYVRPDLKRMGIGSKLFTHTLNHLIRKGMKKLYLSCFLENTGAKHFYEKAGGKAEGKSTYELNGKPYDIQSYRFDLS